MPSKFVGGYANLMNKGGNESQPDFALSKEEFPSLGGSGSTAMNHQLPPQNQPNNTVQQQIPTPTNNKNANNFLDQTLDNLRKDGGQTPQNMVNANVPQKINQQVPLPQMSKSPKPVKCV